MRALGVTRVAVLPDPLIVRLAGRCPLDVTRTLSNQPRDFVGVGIPSMACTCPMAFADLFVVPSSGSSWIARTAWTTGPLFVALGHGVLVQNDLGGRRAVVCGLEAYGHWKTR